MTVGIVGQGTTFNLPNFVGELFEASPADTPLLSRIGGLTGGKETKSSTVQWQGYSLRDAGQNVALEGANAPAGNERPRYNVNNVTEIHQEVVEVSYSKLAYPGQYNGANIAGANPVQNELDFQIQAKLKVMARDLEYSFINGVFAQPGDNTLPRKTRGLIAATTTNVVDAAAGAFTVEALEELLDAIYTNGGLQEGAQATIIVNTAQKRAITKAYLTSGNYREASRNVAGVNTTEIDTNIGTLNVMLNRYMPQDVIEVASLEQLFPVFGVVEGKGHLFAEPLAKVGSSERYQLYCEAGLEYGNERCHGKVINLTKPVQLNAGAVTAPPA